MYEQIIHRFDVLRKQAHGLPLCWGKRDRSRDGLRQGKLARPKRVPARSSDVSPPRNASSNSWRNSCAIQKRGEKRNGVTRAAPALRAMVPAGRHKSRRSAASLCIRLDKSRFDEKLVGL